MMPVPITGPDDHSHGSGLAPRRLAAFGAAAGHGQLVQTHLPQGDPIKFLMLVATDTEPDTDPAPSPDAGEWVRQIGDKWVSGDRLRLPEDGTTVRVRSAEVDVQQGPFTESREQIVGFDVLDCADLTEAIEIVAKHPNARTGRIELRPFWPLDQG